MSEQALEVCQFDAWTVSPIISKWREPLLWLTATDLTSGRTRPSEDFLSRLLDNMHLDYQVGRGHLAARAAALLPYKGSRTVG